MTGDTARKHLSFCLKPKGPRISKSLPTPSCTSLYQYPWLLLIPVNYLLAPPLDSSSVLLTQSQSSSVIRYDQTSRNNGVSHSSLPKPQFLVRHSDNLVPIWPSWVLSHLFLSCFKSSGFTMPNFLNTPPERTYIGLRHPKPSFQHRGELFAPEGQRAGNK